MNAMKLTFLSAAVALVTACGGPIDEASLDESPTPRTGQNQSALGELGCVTTWADNIIDQPLDPGASSQPYRATSPTNTYDHPGECPTQFVVEVRQTKGRHLKVLGGWAESEPLPTTETACPKARAEVGLYGRTADGNWYLVGTAVYKGVWYPEGMFIAHCGLVEDQSTLPDTIANVPYERIRVASRAFRQGRLFPTYVKAQGGVISLQ